MYGLPLPFHFLLTAALQRWSAAVDWSRCEATVFRREQKTLHLRAEIRSHCTARVKTLRTKQCLRRPTAGQTGNGARRVVRLTKKVKGKVFHTRYRALGPELIPVYRQSARR